MKRRKRRQRVYERGPYDVMSIPEFCETNGISVAHYYVLKKRNKTPREMKVGARLLISPEAQADWRRECEAEAEAERQRKRAMTP